MILLSAVVYPTVLKNIRSHFSCPPATLYSLAISLLFFFFPSFPGLVNYYFTLWLYEVNLSDSTCKQEHTESEVSDPNITSIHVDLNKWAVFFWMDEQCFTTISLHIHGHQGGFHTQAIMNSVAASMWIQISVWQTDIHSCDHISVVGLL